MLAAIQTEGANRANASQCNCLALTGNIDINNAPSQLMVERAGWEPLNAPTGRYQQWGAIVRL